MQWEAKDLEDGYKFKAALSDPNSTLSLYLQSLLVLREDQLNRAKRVMKEDSLFKAIGIVAGIDLAINRASEIVKILENELESRKSKKEEQLSYG